MATDLATIYNRTLRRLGVLARGQTATAEDTDDMGQAYNEIYAWLDRHEITSWDSTDDVPDEFVNDIVALMAFTRLDDYGVNAERRASITQAASTSRLNISKLQAAPLTGETEIESF